MTDAPLDPSDTPPSLGAVATDGGPVLLGPRRAFASWEGSRADAAPQGDYHEACGFPGATGQLEREGATITVLPSQVVDVLDPGDGTLWLTLEGMIEELWSERASIVFKPLGRTIEAAELVLLDAAYPLSLAVAEADRFFALPPRAARYEIDQGSEKEHGGYFLVLRLRPAR